MFSRAPSLRQPSEAPLLEAEEGGGDGLWITAEVFCPSPPLCFLHYLLCAKPFFSGGGGGRIIHNALSP